MNNSWRRSYDSVVCFLQALGLVAFMFALIGAVYLIGEFITNARVALS
jgi:hypothetical protein